MGKKHKIYLALAIGLIVILLVVVYMAQERMFNKFSLPVMPAHKILSTEAVPEATESASIASQVIDTNVVSSAEMHAMNNKAVVSKSISSVIPPIKTLNTELALVSSGSVKSSTGRGGQGVMPVVNEREVVVPINAPMTDAQILQAIAQQNKKSETLEQIIIKRDKEAEVVRNNAEADQGRIIDEGQQTTTQNSTSTNVPADIIEKLENQRLVAH